MTEAEIAELMYEALSYSDRNFEFWISASFAVVLAINFSAERMSRLFFRLITFLYCSATILFISRWLVAGLQYSNYRQQLIEMNATIPVTSTGTEGLITLTYAIVILLGSIGTVYFGYRTINESDQR